ncbi:MAG: DUF3768 domain-containing protein [Psychrosphaera sp.]|nr:DUF3768 domain-containing protein [Psychrosphaera sp.]
MLAGEVAMAKTAALLNDELRVYGVGGNIVLTEAIANLAQQDRLAVIQAVREFDVFGNEFDPYKDRTFGLLTVNGQQIFWKIDYDFTEFLKGETSALDVSQIARVLTVMLADEY